MDTPTTILASVKKTLVEDNAPGAEQWTDAQLLEYLNEAGRQIVGFKPSANMVRASISLIAGVAQTLPDGALELFDVEGNTGGGAVLNVDRQSLDLGDRNWRAATATGDVEEYAYDRKVPRIFYVNPPNTGTGAVDAVYSAIPADMNTSPDNAFTLEQVYVEAAKFWMLARAYQQNTKRADTAKATDYFNSFTGLLKGRWASQKENQGGRADGNAAQPT